MATELPIIDLAPFLSSDASIEEKKKVAFEIDRACREVGFFYLKNHGVPQQLIDRMLDNARGFFETATQEEKDKIALKKPGEGGDNARGWLRVQSEEKGTHEAVDMFRPVDPSEAPYEVGMGPNLWPSTPADLRTTAETYIDYLESLGKEVMKAFAMGLGVDEDLLISRVNRAFWNLRILGYEGRKEKSKHYAGIGEHTDFGILTFLLTDQNKKSLQVLNKSGEWIWADPIEGCFICNIGDMLSEWTRGQYKSTLHRVCHTNESLRISIPFFFDPNLDAFIYPVIPAKDGEDESAYGINYREKFAMSVQYPIVVDNPVQA